jgi:glutathione peroxidase-family protein
MKLIFIVLKLLVLFITGISFYTININALDGRPVNIFELSGKKVLIMPFNQSPACAAQLLKLDSLQRADSSIQVIATPAIDFGSYSSTDSLQHFKDSLGLNILITQPMMVKKGGNQDSLYQWLTQVDNNNHFDSGVASEGRIFIINEEGVLYAVTGQNVATSEVFQLLQKQSPDY